MGIFAHRTVKELNGTAVSFQFIYQQDLMNVLARQPIWRRDEQQLKAGQGSLVTQSIQSRTVELRTTVPVIAVDMVFGQVPVWLLLDFGQQTLQLLFNRLRLLLAMARDSGIQGNFHLTPPENGSRWSWVRFPVQVSNVPEVDRPYPTVAPRQAAILSYGRLSSLSPWYPPGKPNRSPEEYLHSAASVSQSQRTSPPSQFDSTPSAHAEFVICDYAIEFNFRDAKQFWGLEDFMHVKQTPLANAVNLSLFMVNLSHCLIRHMRHDDPHASLLDLKALFRGRKYALDTLNLLPESPNSFISEQIVRIVAALGRIHRPSPALSNP